MPSDLEMIDRATRDLIERFVSQKVGPSVAVVAALDMAAWAGVHVDVFERFVIGFSERYVSHPLPHFHVMDATKAVSPSAADDVLRAKKIMVAFMEETGEDPDSGTVLCAALTGYTLSHSAKNALRHKTAIAGTMAIFKHWHAESRRKELRS